MSFYEIMLELWKHHKGKTIGIILGLVFGIMVVSFGFWQTVFIYFCVFLGFFIGKKLDSRINIKESVTKIFTKKDF